MADNVYIFGDESGNLDFSRNGSRFFLITTVTLRDCSVAGRLLDLRRRLAWEQKSLSGQPLHAAEDRQAVRDVVFEFLQGEDFRIDSTVLEKARAYETVQEGRRFYQLAWYLHLKWVATRVASPQDRVVVCAASLGTRKRRGEFREAFDDVVTRVAPGRDYRAEVIDYLAEPCIWIADYCGWAIHRWKRDGDDRSYRLIREKVASAFEPFS